MKRTLLAILLTLALAIPAFADGPVLPDDIKDDMLEIIADACDELHISTDNTVGNSLGSVTLTEGVAGADYSLDNGATDGRELNVAAQEITADGAGTADTWVLYDTDTTTVYTYGTMTSKSITSGDIYDFPATAVGTIRDASTP